MRTLTLFLAAAAATATAATVVSCVKINAFKCDGNDNACGTGGQCESDGFCSVAVSMDTCSSGRQYSDTAGDLSGQCVGGDNPMPDGPEGDGMPPDGVPPDGGRGCPSDYAPLASGSEGNHKYKFYNVTDEWSNQHNTRCVGDGAYLAIPDSAAELLGIFNLAVQADVWVGVTDGPGNGNEGSFKDVLNVAYDATAKVGTAIAGNNQGKDCVKSTNGTTLTAEDCVQTLVAVCECDE